MICHWMIGMQGSTPCQRFGLRLPCWVLTIYAKLLAMTFISWGRSMMSRGCGATSTRNGDSWRASSRPKGLAGIRPLSVRSGFLQTSRIGLVMTWKRLCVPMETLPRGRLGLLRRTSFGSYANLLHPWCFRAKKRFSLTCIPKSGRKNKSSALHIPAFSRMHLWGDERRGSRVRTMPCLGSHHAACAVWHVYWWRGATSGSYFHLGVKGFGHLVWWPIYLKRDNVLSACQSLELECLDRYKHILLRRLRAPTDWHVLVVFASLVLGRQL